jgi:hypothetical protein
MTGPLFNTLLAACLGAAVLGASSAKAMEGRITFTGAVVEPTCTVSSEDEGLQRAAFAASSRRLACGSATDIVTGSASSYVLVVAALNGPDSTGDHLLDYFVGYLSPSARAEAKLVTRTYE